MSCSDGSKMGAGDMQELVKSPQEGQQKPVAIIGIGCRFPRANGPDEFWRLLRDGVDAIREIPKSRFDAEALYDSRRGTLGRLYTRHGGFIDEVERFDAGFFGISPREAAAMDPQHRLLLEVAWEAMEDAGLRRADMEGSRTGVFLGMWTNDYDDLAALRPWQQDLYAVMGSARALASGRISHFLGLEGPSFTVDTACSSSLTAVHLACQSLWCGESEMAFAAGVNLVIHAGPSLGFCGSGMLSVDGRCKFGDASADGFGRSDGVGTVLLKPLDAALRDGDFIYAVIRGTAANNNGNSTRHISVPESSHQADALRLACRRAGLSPSTLQYIEAHGTGTSVGDPVEMGCLAAALRDGEDSPMTPRFVGSVKTNIGHAEGAAGIAGLIKVALGLFHRQIPASLIFSELSPEIPWQELPVEIPQELKSWPRDNGPARGGVASTGLSGTNAFVVVEESPIPLQAAEEAEVGEAGSDPQILTLSGRTASALQGQARVFSQWLENLPSGEALLALACATACRRRTALEHRLAVVGKDLGEMQEALGAFVAGENRSNLVVGQVPPEPGSLAFVFSGQGSQWVGMGRGLLAAEPVFRAAVERCDAAFRPYLGWSVLQELEAGEASPRRDLLDSEQDLLQPLLFTMQVALADLWQSWGVVPEAVVGHSLGEVAAAYVAGILSLEHACCIVHHRSRLLKRRSGWGGMVLIELSKELAEVELQAYGGELSVAICNSRTSTVVAGPPELLDDLMARLEEDEIFCRRVKINFAAHSSQMDELLGELRESLAEIRPEDGAIPFFSAIEPRVHAGRELDAEYWVRNLREPILFADALEGLLDRGSRLFVEVSPHPVLLNAVKESLTSRGVDGVGLQTLRRQESEPATILGTLGALHCWGRQVDWSARYPSRRHRLRLPAYAWQKESFWLSEITGSAAGSFLVPSRSKHPMLGAEVPCANEPGTRLWGLEFEGQRSLLADHRIQGDVLVPGAVFLDLALAAGAASLGGARVGLEEVEFSLPLVLPERGAPSAQLVLTDGRASTSFAVYSRSSDQPAGAWTLHARGKIRPVVGGERGEEVSAPSLSPASLVEALEEQKGASELYQALAARGYAYGPEFQGIEEVWWSGSEVVARLRRVQEMGWSSLGFAVHPGLLDAVIQSLIVVLPEDSTFVPVGLGEFRLRTLPREFEELWCLGRLKDEMRDGVVEGDVRLLGPRGEVVLELTGLRLKVLERAGEIRKSLEESLYDVVWKERQGASPVVREAGLWLLFLDEEGVGDRLRGLLEARGESCLGIRRHDSSSGDWDHQIDLKEPQAFDSLLRGILSRASLPLRGLVYFWSLEIGVQKNLEAERLFEEAVEGADTLLRLLKAVSSLEADPQPLPSGGDRPRVWWITAGSQVLNGESGVLAQAPVIGLQRVIANELPQLRSMAVDLSPARMGGSDSEMLREVEISALCDELLGEPTPGEIALRGSAVFEPVLQKFLLKPPQGPGFEGPVAAETLSFRLEQPSPGVLEELCLRATARRAPGPDEVEIRVVAAGLNFRNVLVALGQVPGEADDLGLECAGTVVAVGSGVSDFRVGDAVMAMTPAATASYVLAKAANLCLKPPQFTFEEAATLTIAYATAYYSLFELGRLKAGERVLIHAATGGVGLAALRLAQSAGAEVFATASSEEKHAFLRSLGVEHIMSSRSMDFADEVMRITQGEGVDLVLNSLAHEGIPKSLSTLAPYGRFLELGKVDFFENSRLGLAPFLRNLSFFAVDLNHMMRERPERFHQLYRETIDYLVDHGLKPLPMKVFPIHQAAEAFRFMAQAKHIGKIVLAIEGEMVELDAIPAPPAFKSDRSYLITGGLGGLGLALSRWMVDHGARHLVLVGRSRPTAKVLEALADLEKSGARVHTAAVDVTQRGSLKGLFEELALSMPPLAGVVHGAMVLDDGILQQMDRKRMEKVMAPKVLGALHLDELSRSMSLDLDFFSLFSSVTSLVGAAGQGNYVAANTFLDALAQRRRSEGLPAVSINWGPWSEVGVAARPNLGGRLEQKGIESFRPEEGLEMFGQLLTQKVPQVGVMSMDWAVWRESSPQAAESSLFAEVIQSSATEEASAKGGLFEELLGLPASQWLSRLEDFARNTVARVLGSSPSSIEPQRSLNQIGLDSLMAVELRNYIGRELDITVSVPKLLGGLSTARLGAELLDLLKTGKLLESLDQLSDEHVGELLGELLATEQG